MASIDLITTGAKLGWGVGMFATGGGQWTLSLDCRLERRRSLRLKTGEKTEDVKFTVGFVSDDSGREHYEALLNKKLADDPDAVRLGREPVKIQGTGHYFAARDDILSPSGPEVHFTINLPADQHARVIEHARHGQFPESVLLGLYGAQFGWEPDGSGTDWDNVEWPIVGVTSVTFSIPLLKESEPVFVSDDQPKLAATSVGADLLPTLTKLAKWQTYTFWALVVLLLVSLGHR